MCLVGQRNCSEADNLEEQLVVRRSNKKIFNVVLAAEDKQHEEDIQRLVRARTFKEAGQLVENIRCPPTHRHLECVAESG